jgi:uridine monophosphate synthetase
MIFANPDIIRGMDSFYSQLEARARLTGSLLCIGLNPYPAVIARPSVEAAYGHCLRLIEATADLALAFKPNLALFECYGAAGWKALGRVVAAVPEGIPVILEAKFGEYNESAETLARVGFDNLKTHAVTLNPFLGYDSLLPFLKDPQKGVFVLCKTTNPGTVDLQELPLAGEGEPLHLYEKIALLAQEWNTANNLGVVVSGLDAEALRRVRQLAPDLWVMAPGVGIPGKDLNTALQAGLRSDGLGMLIPVSRTICHSADPRQATLELRDAVRAFQRPSADVSAAAVPEPRYFPANLADDLLQSGCVRFGQFTLKSGAQTPIYIDMRQLVSYPHVLNEVSAAYLPILRQLKFDRIAGLPYAALPIATTISLKTGWPVVFPRKEARSYAPHIEIEGRFKVGERVVVINDLATGGWSKLEAVDKLITAGLVVEDVVVLIDRQAGSLEALASAGIRLHSVLTLSDLLDYWERNERVPGEQISAVRKFMDEQAAYAGS